MQIRQIQVVHDALQDRLILRVASQNNEEFRIFFTRRFLRELWPALASMLVRHLGARPASINEARPASEPASFEQPFRADDPHYPLGSNPLLASEAKLEPAGDGLARLRFREARERSIDLNLNAELMQALCAMLRATSTKAGWDLALVYGEPAMPEGALTPSTNKPGFLH